MFFPSSLLVLAAAASVQAAIYDITVGSSNGTLAFSPEAIAANVGDQVVFHFQQKNHTATQSSFAAPCSPMEGGFDSGFNFVPANQTDNFPTYTITVNDTKPIWVFCDQAANTAASHCGAGMVFAVNCGADGSANSFTNFKASALAIGQQLKASASAAGTPSATVPLDASLTTAAYGTATIPAAPSESVVTVTVTVEASTWTTVYSSYPGSPAATPASLAGNVHVVQVGNNGTLAYDPPFVVAQPRDIVQFVFHQKNHTATQSSFAAPCLPFMAADGTPGADSGFMPVADNSTDFPSWNITVNDTNPLWFYCKQKKPDGTSHCGAGMVFAVNPVQSSARNFTAFQTLAATLNGTNATGAVSPSGSGVPAPSTTGAAASVGVNLALGLGAVLTVFATML
ncbi:cupredoxin domain-containing protein [Phanerochaete sordida]|uniref:Cupredoxin domain-containing protein n=1 Tax=Phanerochaete sordida TaxID=48140 RepID=A0A9P3G0J8_9APHY|nr:cupredoxin domain-containing protein [Phanerochaete sordida]